jgi:ribosome-binding protein aMBF1 (putative translation factor)
MNLKLPEKGKRRFMMKNKKFDPVPLDFDAALNAAHKRKGFTEAWDALEEEYQTLAALLRARQDAGLTQEALAEKMGTTKSAISRLESSLRDQKHSPSFLTLKKYANACGKKLVVQIV